MNSWIEVFIAGAGLVLGAGGLILFGRAIMESKEQIRELAERYKSTADRLFDDRPWGLEVLSRERSKQLDKKPRVNRG